MTGSGEGGRSTAILVSLLVFALVGAGIATVQLGAAQQQQRLATARLLMSQAQDIVSTDPRAALQLAEAAEHLHPTLETHAALVGLLRSTHYSGALTGHTDAVSSVAFAPDGHTLATGSLDGTILWDVTDPPPGRSGSANP